LYDLLNKLTVALTGSLYYFLSYSMFLHGIFLIFTLKILGHSGVKPRKSYYYSMYLNGILNIKIYKYSGHLGVKPPISSIALKISSPTFVWCMT